MQNRIKTAIEFLKDGQSFTVEDLRLGINEKGEMQVTGWSRYTEFRNLSKAACLEELNEVKHFFSDMLMMSDDLRRFVKDKSIEYSLYFDNYGKSSIGICSEKNNQIKWCIDLE
ncbi:MAG: hypothetical protein JST70_12570 [Bacteroidetes bacterium]|nr:hypothetical protein [Bacteroidota bacterium]